MSEEYPLTLRRANRARAIAAGVLDLPLVDLMDDTPLDSDDLDLVLAELSVSGIKVDRHGVETIGQLIKTIETPTGDMGGHYREMSPSSANSRGAAVSGPGAAS
jgi:hypothetical protein